MAIPLINAFIRLRPDTTGFKAETETKLANLSVKVKLDPQVEQAALKTAIKSLKGQLKGVGSIKVTPDFTGFKEAVERKTSKLKAKIKLTPDLAPNFRIDLQDKINKLRTLRIRLAPNLEGGFKRDMQATIDALGKFEIKVKPVFDLAGLAAFRQQYRLFEQVYLRDRSFLVGPTFDPNSLRLLQIMMRESGDKSGKSFLGSFKKVLAGGGAFVGLVQGANALLAILPVIGELATATTALGAALPALLTAVIAPAVALKLAFNGIGDAFKAAFSGEDAEKTAEALKKLAPPARAFVLEMVSFKPVLSGLQQAVQASFFTPLIGGFRNLVNAGFFQVVRTQFAGIATDAGKAGRGILDVFASSAKGGQLNQILADARRNFGAITSQVPGLVQSFLTLAQHASTFAGALFGGVGGALQRFNNLVAEAAKDGRLDKLFADGLEILRDLGSVLSDVGSILKSVFTGLTQGSEGALGPLSAVLDTLAKFLKTAEAQEALFVLGKTLNALGEAISGTLGPLLPVVAKLVGIIGGTLSQAILDIAPALASFSTALAKILTMIIETGEPIFRVLVSVLSEFLVQAIGEVTKHMNTMMPVLEDLLAELGPALIPVVEEFGKALLELVPIIPEISRAIAAIVPILVELTPVMLFFIEMTANNMKALAAVIREVIVPAIRFMVDAFVSLIDFGSQTVERLQYYWNVFATWFMNVFWGQWIKGALTAIMNGWNSFRDGVSNVLNSIGATASNWWNALRNNVFTPLSNFVTVTLPGAFSRGADAIGTAFGRITGFVRGVVNGTIDMINGLIGAFNTVARAVGVGTIGTIPRLADGGAVGGGGGGGRPPAFTMNGGLVANAPFTMPNPQRRADGGMAFPYSFARNSRPGTIHGPGGGRADRVPLWASAGEFVVNTASTKVWRPVLEWINRHGMRGVSKGPQGAEPIYRDGGVVDGVQRRADGGILGFLEDAWDAITDPVKWVGSKVNGLIDRIPGAGFVRDIGVGAGKKLVGGVIEWIKRNLLFGGGGSGGFPPWPSSPGAQRGDSGVWRAIVALIRSTGPVSGTFGNAYRPGDPLWHGSGRAVDWMGFNQDILATFLAARRPLELIHRTNRRDYAYTRGVNKGSFNNTLMEQHRNHIHAAFAGGGFVAKLLNGIRALAGGGMVLPAGRVRSYDNGGAWPNNTFGLNTSGGTEHVTSMDRMDRLIARMNTLIKLTEQLISTTAGVGNDVGRQITGGAAMLRRTARAR